MGFFLTSQSANNTLLNVNNNNNKHTVKAIVIKIIIAACTPLDLNIGHVTVRKSIHMLTLAGICRGEG